MSVSAAYTFTCNVTETLTSFLDLASDPTPVHQITGGNATGTLNASSTVPATKVWSDTADLSGGTATLDLTSLTGPLSSSITFSGLRVQLVRFRAAADNTAAIVIADGASNGYTLFGDASGQVTLPAGSEMLLFFADTLADVSGSVKTIDLTSSDLDATYSIILVAG